MICRGRRESWSVSKQNTDSVCTALECKITMQVHVNPDDLKRLYLPNDEGVMWNFAYRFPIVISACLLWCYPSLHLGTFTPFVCNSRRQTCRTDRPQHKPSDTCDNKHNTPSSLHSSCTRCCSGSAYCLDQN